MSRIYCCNFLFLFLLACTEMFLGTHVGPNVLGHCSSFTLLNQQDSNNETFIDVRGNSHNVGLR